MNIHNIYKAIAGNISKRLGKAGTRNLSSRSNSAGSAKVVTLPEVFEHALVIADYMERSAAAQLWAAVGKHPDKVHDSMVTLELWMDQQLNRLKLGSRIYECFLGLYAFVAGFLVALFFLPEILALHC